MLSMQELPAGEYIEYLRKSRADLEAESRGEGETLAKHKKALMKLAKYHNVNITRIFEEIVSGESLFHRPEMLSLLDLIETGTVKGVLVMDMDRLGRGNMQEQGLILGKFKEHGVLIITPRKIYDLNDEFDEEYSEFESFMARKELKIITRRLQSGRIRSAEEGNFLFGVTAFGYRAAYTDHGERYLVTDPEKAPYVKLIFEWYAYGETIEVVDEYGNVELKKIEIGAHTIAKRLQRLNVPTQKGGLWQAITVLQMLRNEVYLGRIQIGKKSIKKRNPAEKGSKYISKKKSRDKWIDAKGKHEALIDNETFQIVQEKLAVHHPSLRNDYGLVNPLAGIIFCRKCGFSLQIKTDTRNKNDVKRSLYCTNMHCNNSSSRLNIVESRVLQALEMWIKDLTVQVGPRKEIKSNVKIYENAIKTNISELKQLEEQKLNLFDLLERRLYDEATFLARSKHVSDRIEEVNQAIKKAEEDLSEELKRESTRKDIIPSTMNIIDLYRASKDAQKKNALIKQVLVRIDYMKELGAKSDEFTIEITPKFI